MRGRGVSRIGGEAGRRAAAAVAGRLAGAMPALWTVVALAVLVSPASAQSGIRTEVDTALVTVGDRITLTVSVDHPEGSTVAWPDSLRLDPFEVLDATVLPTRPGPAGQVTSVSLSLAAFELGELELPSFEVAVIGPGGEEEVLRTDRFAIEVVSVGADETGDIRDIRGPLTIGVGVLWIALALLLVLLPMLIVYVLYRRFRPRDAPDPRGVRGPPPRPAHELALEALRSLEASPLLERGEVKEYHIRASEILRTYVERRFRLDALEMTTFEVVRALDAAGVDPGFQEGLRRFLDQCDLVKFAKARPDAAASVAVVHLGRKLVEDTIPDVPVPDVDVERDEQVPDDASTPAGPAGGPARSAAAGVATEAADRRPTPSASAAEGP